MNKNQCECNGCKARGLVEKIEYLKTYLVDEDFGHGRIEDEIFDLCDDLIALPGGEEVIQDVYPEYFHFEHLDLGDLGDLTGLDNWN